MFCYARSYRRKIFTAALPEPECRRTIEKMSWLLVITTQKKKKQRHCFNVLCSYNNITMFLNFYYVLEHLKEDSGIYLGDISANLEKIRTQMKPPEIISSR